jgi:predicted enzyme related to lactoylglutathione lyase
VIRGLAGTTIFSEDHTKLVPFYRDTLGVPVLSEANGFTFFGAPDGAQLLMGSHSELRGPAKEPERQIPSLLSDDAQADYARLKEAGVNFVGEPQNLGPVTVATLRDPENNLVNIVQFH